MVGCGPDPQGGSVDGWRRYVDRSCAAGTDYCEKPDAVPPALGMERYAGATAEPRHRREGQCATHARSFVVENGAAAALPQSLDPDLGHRCRRERDQCLPL